jgi:hypothetical protein
LCCNFAIHGANQLLWLTKLSKAAAEHSQAARPYFKYAIGAESPDQLVFINESWNDIQTSYWLYEWALRGNCARTSAKFVCGTGGVCLFLPIKYLIIFQ